MKKIPCLDLKQQHQNIKKEIFEAFEKVYDETAFSSGHFVEEFEKQFASFCNVKYAVGVSNGTVALQLATHTLGIGKGDEIILPANTFIATAWAASHIGATPVFADCNTDTWEIDAQEIEKKITSRTKAIIGVHLYGQPFDIDVVSTIAKKHNLFLIEDAAQAQGAKYKGTVVGGLTEMGCFSFYPGKNLGACGEAGCITTNNESYYTHLLSLRSHGSMKRYYHDEIGYNARMGGLEGASLSVKLKHLEQWNTSRKAIAKRYHTEIKNPKIKMQVRPSWADSIYHLFVITTNDRDDMIKYLNEKNIFPALHYPVPCHLQKAYSYLNYKRGDCPNSEYLAEHCLSLPMYAELSDDEVAYVIDSVNKY